MFKCLRKCLCESEPKPAKAEKPCPSPTVDLTVHQVQEIRLSPVIYGTFGFHHRELVITNKYGRIELTLWGDSVGALDIVSKGKFDE